MTFEHDLESLRWLVIGIRLRDETNLQSTMSSLELEIMGRISVGAMATAYYTPAFKREITANSNTKTCSCSTMFNFM